MRRGWMGVNVVGVLTASSLALASIAGGSVGAVPASDASARPDQSEQPGQPAVATVTGIVVHTATRQAADAAGRRSVALTGVPAAIGQVLAGGYRLIELDEPIAIDRAEAISQQLVAEGLADTAEPDYPRYESAPPNDTLYAEQWNLSSSYHGDPNEPAYGIDVESAWNITTGSSSLVVAVLDSGILPHPDIVNRVVPGYDMISSPAAARDGGGRDSDPFDEGSACGGNPSSWHGLHVAGTIGAETGNGTGIAGVDQQARIQPVRVLGMCGGSATDVADAIRWAAGLPVPDVPLNATPAKVINLSLGGPGNCMANEQDAINAAVAAGAVVVVAAGNESVDLDSSSVSPANCANVITVAATSRYGDRAAYSNFGSTVEIAGPGGEQVDNPDERILSTLNSGLVDPDLTAGGWVYRQYQGTSMAAPHISGVIS
ncbi:MAG TPA: S8 family serine peptidase, partial [Ilumatobacteraceae bacterium]|nr:S8 family serine peptidase [Ilumatobacteraceae bacterium]